MASYEMKCHNESGWWFMVVERRAAAAKLAMARQAACQSAHRHNMAAAREEMAIAGW
jgi:hypothetical protein